MRNFLIILVLLALSTAILGCEGATGPCPQGVCSEEHSKEVGPPAEKSGE